MTPRAPLIQILPEVVEVPPGALCLSSNLSVRGVVDEAGDVVSVRRALGIGAEKDALDGAVD